jgi:hypothetical protein
MAKMFSHFSALFLAPTDVPEGRSEERVRPEVYAGELKWNDTDFTENEVLVALDDAAVGKAMGFDGIPNEVLKLPELLPPIRRCLNQMLAGMVPQMLRTSVLVPVPKKGDLSNPNNWRGISLMPHITKLFDRMLLNRLRPVINPHLLPSQNGFRPDRGTAHHIIAFTQLLDLARTRKYPLHGMFVDFSKAFDSVRWSSILQELAYWRVPARLIDAAFSVIRGHALRVRCDGALSDPIAAEVGVLQGDTLAPFLFVVVLDAVLRKLPSDEGVLLSDRACKATKRTAALAERKGVREKRLHILAYADDCTLFSHTSEGLPSIHSIRKRGHGSGSQGQPRQSGSWWTTRGQERTCAPWRALSSRLWMTTNTSEYTPSTLSAT